MKINGKETQAKQFAYDGCHKIYIIENDADLEEALSLGYKIRNIELLEETYNNSCELRFINNWKLDTVYVGQFEELKLEVHYEKARF